MISTNSSKSMIASPAIEIFNADFKCGKRLKAAMGISVSTVDRNLGFRLHCRSIADVQIEES